jgi:hypothetical protein
MLSVFLNLALFVGVFYLITLFAASGDRKSTDTRGKRAA